jgi:heterodisulfide reductase subunit B
MLENPQQLREIVEKTGAHSTDLQSPESAEHLCAKCDAYAQCWKPTADKLWEEAHGA